LAFRQIVKSQSNLFAIFRVLTAVDQELQSSKHWLYDTGCLMIFDESYSDASKPLLRDRRPETTNPCEFLLLSALPIEVLSKKSVGRPRQPHHDRAISLLKKARNSIAYVSNN